MALLVAGPPALGAAPWSDLQAVPGTSEGRWELIQGPGPGFSGYGLRDVQELFGFTPGGMGVAVLGRDGGGLGISRFSGSTGTFGAPTASRLGGVVPSQMALYGREGMVLGGQANLAGDPRSGEVFLDAAVTRGSVTGAFARRQILAKGRDSTQAVVTALAANAAGDAAAVVSVPVRGAGHESRLFIRRRGQSAFRKVADIGIRTVGKSPAALAVNGPGDVLVAWDDRTSVRARLVTASGKVGAEQRLGQGGSPFRNQPLVAAMDGTRRMLVAWLAQSLGQTAAGGPGIVALASASPYRSFRPAQVVQRNLPRGDDRAVGGPAAALLRNRGVVVWNGYVNGHYVVRSVDVTSGRAGSRRNLSPLGTDTKLQGLAVGARGGTIAAWSSRSSGTVPQPTPGVFAVTRAADVPGWGPIETVATTRTADVGALIAASPVSGQALLIFSLIWDVQPPAYPNPVPVRFSVRSSPD